MFFPLWNSLPWPGFSFQTGGLEAIFYDLTLLTPEDHQHLIRETGVESRYILSRPGKPLAVFESHLGCVLALEGASCDICLPGISSSLMGTAAMVKRIADESFGAVIGVVSEFGLVNLQAGLARYFSAGTVFGSNPSADVPHLLPSAEDCQPLIDLLLEPELKVRSIVGHSRGAYLMNEVFNRFGIEILEAKPGVKLFTLGAVVDFAEGMGVTQYLGQMDWTGRLYSDLSIAHIDVVGCGHHLNAKLPGSMPMDFLKP